MTIWSLATWGSDRLLRRSNVRTRASNTRGSQGLVT